VCHHPVPENNRPFSRPPIQINKEIDYYLIVVCPLFSCPKNFLDSGGAAFPPFPSLSLPVTPLYGGRGGGVGIEYKDTSQSWRLHTNTLNHKNGPVIYYPIYNGSQYSRGIS